MPQSKTAKLRPLIRNAPVRVAIPERMTWTASSLRLFRRCRRKFFWSYMVRLEPRTKSVPLWVGTLFHEGLARWYRNRRAPMANIVRNILTPALQEARERADLYGQSDYDKLSHGLETLGGMLQGYALYYGDERGGWVYDRRLVERELTVEFPAFDFTGKVDLLFVDKRGRLGLVDHKTTSRIDPTMYERLPLDTQMRAYVMLAEQCLDKPVYQVVYDVVRKPSLRRKTDETAADFDNRLAAVYYTQPRDYFHRTDVILSHDDIDAFIHELHQTHAEYQAIVDGEYGDPRDPRTWNIDDSECTAYFRLCPYFLLCTTGLDRGTARGYTQRETLHAELDGEK